MDQTHYAVLGVSPHASKDDIRAAYKQRMREVHPDVNRAHDANERAARINEAHRVLTDDARRRAYDAILDANLNMSDEAGHGDYTNSPGTAPPDIRCQRCGVQDSSLRIAVLYRAISIVFRAYRNAKAGLWCDRCRAIESLPDSVISLVFGWWCFPWGPIFALQTALTNFMGGEKPAQQNAAMLRMLAHILYNRGEHAEAVAAARASQKFQPDPSIATWLSSQPTKPGQPTRPAWLLVPAIPVAVFAAIVGFVMYVQGKQPTGYEARYQPVVAAGIVTPKPEDPHRKRANEAVERLAGIIQARSPIVGTEVINGQSMRHYELDRSKFEIAELYDVQRAVDRELEEAPSDPDGFIASCAFNARVFALSVDLSQRLDAGLEVTTAIQSVRLIAVDPRIQTWLAASPFATSYQKLKSLTDEIADQYQPGEKLSTLTTSIEDASASLKEMKAKLKQLENAEDVATYNRLVDRHNSLLSATRSKAENYDKRASFISRLDDVANECLDRELLLTRFDTVDLKSQPQDGVAGAGE